ncbi:MAG: phosphoribosylanthranilate isomerase [Pseudomonadota bacterium]
MSKRTRIKICGLTRVEDALAAIAAGADALGLVFYAPSPRSVDAAQAAEIVAAIPPLVTTVGLFVNASESEIRQTLDAVRIDLMQFHGDESPAFCDQFSCPWIKAVRVRQASDIASTCEQYQRARGILLDSWDKGARGGTGTTFDWNLAQGQWSKPVLLAGGLDPDNVAEAVERVQPWAVDVSSGVEQSPGYKDSVKIANFVDAVRRADSKLVGAVDDQ